jgi:hypothetical protein
MPLKNNVHYKLVRIKESDSEDSTAYKLNVLTMIFKSSKTKVIAKAMKERFGLDFQKKADYQDYRFANPKKLDSYSISMFMTPQQYRNLDKFLNSTNYTFKTAVVISINSLYEKYCQGENIPTSLLDLLEFYDTNNVDK